MPSDLKSWQSFFDRVNTNFFDFDQERYLLERSMELSSAEFMEINQHFEQAEATARIGHWNYRPIEGKIFWSREMFSIFGIQEGSPLPDFHHSFELFHEEDRDKLKGSVDAALTNGKSYEIEVRIYFPDDKKIHWVYIKGIPTLIETNTDISKQYQYNLSGIVMDINDQILSEEKLEKLNQQLIVLSRQAGMSEVAASVLHNIGNILNSANVSIVMLQELLTNSDLSKLETIPKIIQEGISKNKEYLVSDSKGKLILPYLSKLSQSLISKQKEMINEMKELNKHIDHIKDIVLMQNQISNIAGIKENISIEEICNQAIKMSYGLDEKNDIKISRHFEYKETICVDKTKILQILVNLIRNAKEALAMHSTTELKLITLLVRESEKGFIEIQVSDNGVGIEKQHLKNIFSMGFTTKNKGHGFGLHMSAIAAKEMGGELIFSSQGKNQGAAFILKLPIERNGDGVNTHEH